MAPFPFWWIKGLPGLAEPMMTNTGGHCGGGSPPGDHIIAFALPSGVSDNMSPKDSDSLLDEEKKQK